MQHSSLKFESKLLDFMGLMRKISLIWILSFLYISHVAHAQTQKTIKYIEKYPPTIPECFNSYVPKEFYLTYFFNKVSRDTLILPYYKNQADSDNLLGYFINKPDTHLLYIFRKNVLKETWDYALNADSTKDKFRIIKSNYSYYPSRKSLVVNIVTVDQIKGKQIITRMVYNKDLLTRVEIFHRRDTSLNMYIKYKNEFLTAAKTDSIFPFPFDTIEVNLLLPGNLNCLGYHFTFYSWQKNRNSYRSESKYYDCYWKFAHLSDELRYSGRTMEDVFSFFLLGRVYDRMMIYQYEKSRGCGVEIIKN